MLDVDECCSLLADLLQGIESRPISSSERAQIELEIQNFVSDNDIKRETPILCRLLDRMSFSYFPTVSNLKYSSFEKKSSLFLEMKSKDGTEAHPAEHLRDFHPNYCSLALQPAKADVLYVCSIRRIKSALSISYRMSIANTKSLGAASISAHNTNNGGKIYDEICDTFFYLHPSGSIDCSYENTIIIQTIHGILLYLMIITFVYAML